MTLSKIARALSGKIWDVPSRRVARPVTARFVLRPCACIQTFLLTAALLPGALSCVKARARVNADKPVEHTVVVNADSRGWQRSGIRVRAGQIIQCRAEGEWSDHFSSYGPEGNPDIYKKHFGVNAPANSLIMSISTMTNVAFYIGKQTNVVAERSGDIRFRKNYSLPIGMDGKITVKVKICPDADGDGLGDYDEITIWKTDPLRADSDGDGFSDYEEAAEMLKRSPRMADPSAKSPAAPAR